MRHQKADACWVNECDTDVTPAEPKVRKTSLGFLANLNHIPFCVANFEELSVTSVLNRPDKDTAACELVVPFL